ncbi:P-II family nitrogen regulator [Herbivorax sp. ANBcel31]|uniref:P-II family nitrogen regulator n=1 Tax=Herbivorax sp. ANBcel31 TaxID=3069754 RepID=UPI0027AEE947|nr:P-II family nitrogen regulator [Herbivorax sp. ANBcel31]MDQ2086571.1 P-II family nitrogen regulator [Herbivorax sp. ANBcel31]
MNTNELSLCNNHKLIVTIVRKGKASSIVDFTKKHSAKGGTILLGKGTADKKKFLKLFSVEYDPAKEIILTLVEDEKADYILDTIIEKGQLNKPGKGIAFVINVKNVCGIFHLLKLGEMLDYKEEN